MVNRLLRGSKREILTRAAVLVAFIAIVDWKIDRNLTLGLLYLFPILLVSTVLKRWQIVLVVLGCTFLCDYFDPFPFTMAAMPQDLLLFAGLLGAGLFSHEAMKNRVQQVEHLRQVEKEIAVRRDAEEQLEFLIESSPAAIITMDMQGNVLQANSAAHRMVRLPSGSFAGRNVARYLPALARTSLIDVPQSFHTQMQCKGLTETNEAFLANVSFSNYRTGSGPRIAAFVIDASDELRDREEVALHQMLAGSRLLAHAVSHEIRNLCGAISLVHENLRRGRLLDDNRDFGALGSLVEALSKIASLELRESKSELEVSAIDLRETLDELRIVLEMSCREAGIEVLWEISDHLPLVLADRHSLLQVFLNLTRNSERALANSEVKQIRVSASITERAVLVRVSDTGPGIASLDKLFQPFQQGADATGLGLYLSRAFMHSFGGDLRHEPSGLGCEFVIELVRPDNELKGKRVGQNEENASVVA